MHSCVALHANIPVIAYIHTHIYTYVHTYVCTCTNFFHAYVVKKDKFILTVLQYTNIRGTSKYTHNIKVHIQHLLYSYHCIYTYKYTYMYTSWSYMLYMYIHINIHTYMHIHTRNIQMRAHTSWLTCLPRHIYKFIFHTHM
jgi:hypothetical protein